MRRCSRCGEKNKDEDKFCRNCGTALNASKPAIVKNGNIFDRFRNANALIKIIMIISAIFIVLLIIGLTPHIFLGVPFDSLSEEAESSYLVDFNVIDMDCDGALTFDEADGYAPEIDHEKLSEFFDEADKNHNGVLKGGEFDGYVYKIKQHSKELEKQKKDDEQAAKEKKSSSSSSIHTVNLGKCPSCGSDECYIYEYFDELGHPYYECTVCGYRAYDYVEFYDN